jgi:O-antigen/teichoic acid export membrane protein
MTVSNLLSPLLMTCDRFLIGGLISVGAVAYYATPYEAVTKLWVIPTALMSVMFPEFSTTSIKDPDRLRFLFVRSVKYIFLLLFPPTLFAVVLAENGLRAWLGVTFAKQSTHVLQWLALGVFVNSLAQASAALVQASGKPDLTAKLHLFETPIYLALLYWLTKRYGIEGAAIAWTGRVTIDALLLFGLAKHLLAPNARIQSTAVLMIALAFVTLAASIVPQGTLVKTAFLTLTSLTFVSVTWFLVLEPDERMLARWCLR